MKKKLIISILLISLLFVLAACDSPVWNEVATLEVVELNTGLKSYDNPYYYGTVKNSGNVDLYNVEMTFKIYETSKKETIVDTASAYPANLGTINVDQKATFEAVAFNLNSTAELEYYDLEITHLIKE